MCKYCSPSVEFSTDADYPYSIDRDPPNSTIIANAPIVVRNPYARPILQLEDRQIWIDGNTLFADNSNREYNTNSAIIYFCPMCGRKLNNA